MKTARKPAVAGQFYPADPHSLEQVVTDYLSSPEPHPTTPSPAIIAPHAGYVYSGPIAGSSYRCLNQQTSTFERVVVISPSHTLKFRGVAASSASAFDGPLGNVPLDQEAILNLQRQNLVSLLDKAHDQEHGIEVHLPFLQLTVGSFELVPLVTGSVSPQIVADVIAHQLTSPNTLIVISSDLSHYYDYATAQQLDRFTADAIETLRPDMLEPQHACGRIAIQGLLLVAHEYGWSTETVDLRNSGDTAGSKKEVVGYGAFVCKS